MATARSGLITSALALALLAGCTPAQPTLAPPQPSPTCTPEGGGKAYPCSPYYYDQMVAKDKLYTEAEAVYRKYLAEDERIYRAGGVTQPTPVLLETTTGQYLADSMRIYRDLHSRHSKAVGGEFKRAWFKRVPGESMAASVVALKVCTDPSTVRIGPNAASSEPGVLAEETGYFARVSGELKLTMARTKVVTKC